MDVNIKEKRRPSSARPPHDSDVLLENRRIVVPDRTSPSSRKRSLLEDRRRLLGRWIVRLRRLLQVIVVTARLRHETKFRESG